ncbi:MAG: alpha-amylase family glycosyl hydrolase [Elainellaceae cyanobacterium]
MSRSFALTVATVAIASIGWAFLQPLTPAHAAANPAEWQPQVIYLVMPDRFENGDTSNDRLGDASCFDPSSPTRFHGGDWTGLRQRIDYLQELGVTAVWTTPATRQIGEINDSCGYHGYWADLTLPDDTAIEPKLGTESDLRTLIQALHDAEMKFILDQVINHVGYDARLVQQRPQWFNPAIPACEALGSPEIFCPLAGLPDFDFRNADAVDYITRHSLSWLQRFPIDGIRMDTFKHVPSSYFRNVWIPLVNQADPQLFTVGELLDTQSLDRIRGVVDTGFDSAFNFPLQSAFVNAYAKEGSVDAIATVMAETWETFGDRALMLTNLLDNHDMPRFVNQPGFGIPEAEIRRRYQLALGSLFTLPGIPQLYYGNEIGLYGGADPDNRRDMPDWVWAESDRAIASRDEVAGALANPKATFDYTQQLIALRQANPALHSGYYAELWRQNGASNPNVYAFFRGLGHNRVIVVINNGSQASGEISIPIQPNTNLEPGDRTVLRNGVIITNQLDTGAPAVLQINDDALQISMPPKTLGIYKIVIEP